MGSDHYSVMQCWGKVRGPGDGKAGYFRRKVSEGSNWEERGRPPGPKGRKARLEHSGLKARKVAERGFPGQDHPAGPGRLC